MSDRLFVPLKTEHYRNFESGEKEWELRGKNNQFNPNTVQSGRRVELRRGYSTDDSLWGTITGVEWFMSARAIPERIDHELILPNSTVDEFVASVQEMLGKYDDLVAFRVELD